MRTTLKRGIGRAAVVNGDGRAVLPPGALSPIERYRQPERRGGPLRTAGRILFVLLALCVAALIGLAGGSYLTTLESINAISPKQAVKIAAQHLNRPLPDQPTTALVIGYDHRPSDGNAPSRSDTLMLIRADPQANTISLLSFPRDLIVNGRCPDGRTYTGKINAAYAYCGPAGSLLTIRSLTGLPIHYLIAVNFDAFRQTVDRVGGVWLDVDHRYLNNNKSGGPTYTTINLWPGYQRLNGDQALDFVRFRHTDSDLFRVARQQQFVKAMKQAMSARWKDPTNIFGVLAALRRNIEIGQAGGNGISFDTLKGYLLFAYGLPSGNFFQVKIGGLTGANDLHTDMSNIQTAVAEFLHPDVSAAAKATAQVLHRRLHTANGPSPRNVSVVVLNGNGVPGSAANTSYLLGQKGYRVGQPPQGFQANAPQHVHNTQIYFSAQKGARLAAVGMAKLFDLADVSQLPPHGQLAKLSNGAMLTVAVGQTFTGHMTPTPVDRTPARQPPNVGPGTATTLPVVRRAAAWKIGFPLQFPSVIDRSSALDFNVPYRVYRIGDSKAVRLTFRTAGNEYWGIQETNWSQAPILDGKNFTEVIKRRAYDFYYSGPHLHMIVLRAGGATYWVVNTVLDSLSNETMLAIAKGLKPLRK